jgi:CRP/FNR family cyclic AMP-dependent transcriptional regulator
MEISWQFAEKDFFRELPAERKDFLSLSTFRSFKKNQFIFQSGSVGDTAFYLEEGKVRIFRDSPAGKEAIVFIRHAGEMFGLAEIIGQFQRVNNARAITPCRVYEIKKKDLEFLLQRHFSLVRRVMEVLGRRLRYLGEQLESLMVGDVSTRLLKALTFMCCHNLTDLRSLDRPIAVPVNLTQEQIAAMIGSSQQTVSGTQKRFREEGLISMTGKKILILKPREIFGRILS